MTSPNATQVSDLPVPVATVPDALHAGFRQEWVDVDDGEGVTATLTSGAGCGSPYMVLTIERDGERIMETLSVTDLLPLWIEAALSRADAS